MDATPGIESGRSAAGQPPTPGARAAAPDICVIANTGSGPQEAEREQALEAAFAAFPGRFALRKVTRGAELEAATRRAIDEGFTTIVAAGGDGTAATVAGCLVGTACRMGVLPLGTFNYFARSLDLPETLEEAARVIVEGEVRAMDVGEVNGRVFLNNASLGAYPTILREREEDYRRWGRNKLVAYWSLLVTLFGFRRPLRIELTIDGETRRLRTPLLFVARNDHQLDAMKLEGGACIKAGRFAVFVAPDAGRLGLVVFAARLALGLSERREDFELFCGREVVVVSDRPRRFVAHDGEPEEMQSPFRFRLRPDALKVIVPPGVVPPGA